MKKFFLLLLLVINISCTDDDPGDVLYSSEVVKVTGARYSASNVDFNNTYSAFMAAVNEEDSLEIFLEINHAANAIALGRVLNPSRLLFFGSPGMMIPLLQENQLAGLDLPQRMLFYQNVNSEVFAVYNTVPYLSSRYGLEQAEPLQHTAVLLKNLANAATRAEVRTAADLLVEQGQGIISKKSTQAFDATYSAVRRKLGAYENVTILTEINFQDYSPVQESENILRPTKLVIFGMPQLGTPLMQDSPTLALDVPQKILVWEDEEGITNISYNDPAFLADRHNLPATAPEIEQIAAVLDEVSSVNTTN
ncbi:DUF302 domain-containing protein [Zunongwangia sp. F363]|uniref:DUF302 domain-containing protein n=1 Tax=Autumnicola tepida TaxID=3075595 RepID=A0ABU3C581_9FLAO|nr:DUF302 domain-containing protein [Zunongwangia sp. F363]MDT0641501.1 DUF302 domain-containing protein [Zunongwangia sp. F363]